MRDFCGRLSRWTLVATLVVLGAGSTGCATNGRQVLLKEYGPTVPEVASALNGKTICIKRFECAPSLTAVPPTTPPIEPAGFKFEELPGAQDKVWGKELEAAQKSVPKADWREIGNLRNGFGMTLSHVYALNDPGAWLADTLRMDLEKQGAKVVPPEEAENADVCVSGDIQFCRVDIYMKIWGDLVVELAVTRKGRDTVKTVLHTEGGTVAWVASEGEFYKPIRECRQKFSWLALQEIAKLVQR
ncbi:MAG TPA: hypothetical protein PLX89_05265 [Verrucomicrobiota bacterium]|nr:hypothetical protein [Verrucomicrobiota bacterium]